MAEQDSKADLAGIITGALLLALAVAILVVPSDAAYLRSMFTPEHLEQLGMFDNRGQQWVHRSLVLLLGAAALILWLRRPVTIWSPPAPTARLAATCAANGGLLVATVVILAAALGGRSWSGDVLSFQGRYLLLPVVSLRSQLALVALGVLLVYGMAWIQASTSRLRAFTVFAIASTIAALLGYILLANLRQPDFSGFWPGLVAGVEWHYSGSVASADRLGIGERLGEVPIHSALLPSILLGAWQQANGMLDFGGHIRLLTFLQTVLLLVAVAGYGIWYTRRVLPWLAALLLVFPWIQPLHAAVLYPNQSAWRFLAFCAGVALLAAMHASGPRRLAALLGLCGGLALLWNPETGIVLCLAYVTFLVLRATSPSPGAHISAVAASFAGGGLGAALLFAAAVRLGLGYWPDATAIAGSFPLIGDFSKGYGGLPFKAVDALAVLVFAHALFLTIRGLLQWGAKEPLDTRQFCRIALAALLVVWAAYYFKAPDPWNLWSFLFLYGFLLDDLLPGSAAPRMGEFVRSFRSMALALVVLPAIFATNFATLRAAVLAVRQPPCPAGDVVSGICLPADLAKAELDKAAALRERAAGRTVLYFTADSYLMPQLSGVRQPLAHRDPFSESILITDFERLISAVQSLGPQCLLFDDPESALSGYDAYRKFYKRLREAIGGAYAPQGIDRGWQVFCRK